MANNWSDVIAKPEFQALSDDQKAAAQDQYFTTVVAPKVQDGGVEQARSQFLGAYPKAGASKPVTEPLQPQTPAQAIAASVPTDIRQQYAQDAINKAQADADEQARADSEQKKADADKFASDQAARGGRGAIGAVSDFFTGADRQTDASKDLPELTGLLQNQGVWDGVKTSAALALTPNDEEASKILKAANPNLVFEKDAAGNIIGSDPTTGAKALVNAPGASMLDALQVGTGLLAYAPAGRAATAVGGGALRQAAALGAASAATEAAIQGVQQQAGGTFDGDYVAISGALGAAAPLVGGAIGAAADTTKRVAGAIRGAPAADDPLIQAAQRADIPVMTSDIAPPRTPIGQLAQRTGERIPYAGTGGPRVAQQEARVAAVDDLAAQYAPPQPSEIVDSLKSQTSLIKRAAGNRLGQYSAALDAAGPVPYVNTTTAIDDAIAKLSRPGVSTSQEAIAELNALKSTLSDAPQSYSMLRENRTAFTEMLKGFDSPLRSQLPSRAKGLLTGVRQAMSRDMDEAAKTVLSPRDVFRLNQANSIYAEQAQQLTNTRLKNVLDKGDLTPEAAESLLFSKKPSEAKMLYESLGMKGRQAARATIVQKMIKDATATGLTSPERFLSSINKLGPQVDIYFKGDAKTQLQGLQQVLLATKRASQIGLTSTGQESTITVMAAGAGSALGSFGGTLAAGGAVGGLARLYESAPVRNALLRIGKQPNSQESKKLALELARQLNAGMQTANSGADE